MAPRKTPVSRAGYDTTLFKNAGASTRYSEIYANIKVCIGRGVNFNDFANFRLYEYLSHQHWEHLFTNVEEVYPRLVRLFFANVSVSEDRRTISSYVKGVKFHITPDLLGEILHVPLAGFDIYYSDLETFEYPDDHSIYQASAIIRRSRSHALVSDRSVKNLNQNAYLLAKLLFDSLLPKGGDTDYVRGPSTLLIYLLMSKQQVNLPHLIMDCICDSSSPRRNLPYGSILTIIFRYFHINLDDEQIVAPQAPFAKRVITNMLKTISGASSSAAGGDEEEEEESGEEEDSDEDSIESRLTRLEERVDTGFNEQQIMFSEVNEKLDSLIHSLQIDPRRRR